MHTSMLTPHQLLEWYQDAGVDEAVDDDVTNYFSLQKPAAMALPPEKTATPTPIVSVSPAAAGNTISATSAPPLHHTPSAALARSRALADQVQTLEELEKAVREFDGCAIKKTASKTVFCDGNPKARVMIIGEAPGAQEDIQGIPFCGPSGMLLDRMLAAIGLDRTSVYISNTVFWRPPGNRQPSPEETAICLPFVEKHIALVKPALLLLSGGTATNTLLRKEASISRLRGKLYEYSNSYLESPLHTAVTFHPSYLLRSPAQKRLAWHDLLMVKAFLDGR